MKQNLPLALLITALYSSSLCGLQAEPKDSITPAIEPPPADNVPISQEFTMEAGYSGKAETKQGSAKLGDVDNFNNHFNYVVSPQVKDGVLLRFGVDWERNSFGLFPNAPLPNTLQSISAVIGADLALNDQILLRAELHPGIYSDFVDITGNDFDMPVQIGGTYLWNKDFQIILGFQLDLKSDIPFIGIPGFRWQFADKWVLSVIPPKPQLQYQLSSSLTLYLGADILAGTYQLNRNFGSLHGHGPGTTNAQFNNNVCDFTEVRVGAGFTWKFTPNLSLDASAGYMPYREFDIHPSEIGYDNHSTSFRSTLGNGAPYGEIGVSGSF
jgi:hypothetical protein